VVCGVATDKYSPDTCCIVGNYYSLKGQHEKAVEYFRRALRLNSRYLAAWTLMGHEFMEMKNTAAAIEAYRRAVDLNPHDFRAWYGLGQAYELLKMPYYAVYYYRRATSLRPSDARMWVALGQCYMSEQVALVEQAARCYRRAIESNDPDGIAAHMLAKLYEGKRQYDAAEQLYRYNLARLDAAGLPLGADAVDALLFLAGRCKDTGRLSEAQGCCERLLDVGGPAKERAKALAREVHALLQAQQQAQQVAQHVQAQAQAAAAARQGTGDGDDVDDGMETFSHGTPPLPWQRQMVGGSGGAAEAAEASAGPGQRGGAASPGQGQPTPTASQQQLQLQQHTAAVAGVAQQLRVGEREAAVLLAQAGMDASRAVRENLHLLD
jgi:anaphase-promoting complex subunit 8